MLFKNKICRAVTATLALTAALAGFGTAGASTLTVSDYSMVNGGTGSYNYRDFTYSNCAGVCDITSSNLSGGVGKLTDGISPSQSWYQYGQNTPWVGWYTGYQNATNPVVTFNFGGTVTVDSVTVWLDDSFGYGGVNLPSSVKINGTSFLIAPDNINPLPRAYTFSGLNIIGTSVDVQFFQSGSPWVMVGEVSFDGSNGQSVPEPASLALLGLGLAGLAAARRRKTS